MIYSRISREADADTACLRKWWWVLQGRRRRHLRRDWAGLVSLGNGMWKGPARKKLISLTHGMHEYRRWSWPVPAYKWHWQGRGVFEHLHIHIYRAQLTGLWLVLLSGMETTWRSLESHTHLRGTHHQCLPLLPELLHQNHRARDQDRAPFHGHGHRTLSGVLLFLPL